MRRDHPDPGIEKICYKYISLRIYRQSPGQLKLRSRARAICTTICTTGQCSHYPGRSYFPDRMISFIGHIYSTICTKRYTIRIIEFSSCTRSIYKSLRCCQPA